MEMNLMIKNIVFDIGNVLVKWDPLSVVKNIFPTVADPVQLTTLLFKSELWFAINRGEMSENELISKYHQTLNINIETLKELLEAIKESLVQIPGSFELLDNLYKAPYPLYALTDNTYEIMNYLQKRYDFWNKFKGIVMSAEIGYLKPSPQIYKHLLETYQLIPQETLFMDDYLINVEGARAVNMQAIQFVDAQQCVYELSQLGIV